MTFTYFDGSNRGERILNLIPCHVSRQVLNVDCILENFDFTVIILSSETVATTTAAATTAAATS